MQLSAERIDEIKLAAQMGSLVVSVVAVALALRAERRNQRRFGEQLEQSRVVARAAARPILAVVREGYLDEKAITIANHGPGTAIITSIEFLRGVRVASDVSQLIELDPSDEIPWREATDFDVPYFIPGKSVEEVIRIDEARLTEVGMPVREQQRYLEALEAQLDEVSVHVVYEDVFGQRFELKED